MFNSNLVSSLSAQSSVAGISAVGAASAVLTADKYDRQLRLWGSHGQAALNAARVLVLGAGPTGAQALKGLVLPGVGHVTLVDGDTCAATGSVPEHFFASASSAAGSPRAAAVLAALLEMNGDVAGAAIAATPAEVLSRPNFLEAGGFSLVIATQAAAIGSALAALAERCEAAGVPLLALRTCGLLATVRLCIREHLIFESKPMSALADLRVKAPWPALRAFCDSIDLAAVDDMTARHVPYLVLLVKALDSFKVAHGGAEPATPAAKVAFRAALRDLVQDGGNGDVGANVEEAIAHAALAFASAPAAGMTDDARSLLSDPAALPTALRADSPPFWIIAAALRGFAETHGGALPLSGELPDMTSTTDMYLSLQRLFAAKAAEDATEVHERAMALAAAAGALAPSAAQVRETCKHARFLRALRVHSAAGEIALDEPFCEALRSELGAAAEAAEAPPGAAADAAREQAPVVWYTALRAADAFADLHGRVPGAGACDDLAADAAEVFRLGQGLLERAGAAPPLRALFTAKHAAEVVRYGGAELQMTAAIIGGVAAQEAVKLLTHQYTPMDNSFVYCGIAGTSAVFQF